MSAMAKQEEHEEGLLPEWAHGLRGRLRRDVVMAKRCWFAVGGAADWLFIPEDREDLCQFMRQRPLHVPLYIIGVGSNLLVRDGGLRGIAVRLGAGFAQVSVAPDGRVRAGAGALDVHVAQAACEAGIAGLEFLCGVPGTIGGAVAMNAGAYGRELKDILLVAELVDDAGQTHLCGVQELGFSYRRSRMPQHWVCTGVTMQGHPEAKEIIAARMQTIMKEREESQPTRARTGGSTFKNPLGLKAWQLVDDAGCRGLTVGDAEVSEKHCNFLINRGEASAYDLEALGEEVRRRVLAHSGVELEWEIKRIGEEQ